MNILFLMYPWESFDPTNDSTILLIQEAATRGHRVAITTAPNLTIRESVTMAFCKMIDKEYKIPKSVTSFYNSVKFNELMLPLAGFDVIFMRANPPLDNLVLNFLDSVKQTVFIVNDVEGLREANNKIYTAAFNDPDNRYIPKTYVSKNIRYLRSVIDESESKKMIMKPLNGYGGSGVIVLEKGATQNINSLLDFYISGKDGESNYVIVQDYVEGAENGDVRVLLLHGEPIGAIRRVPAKGDARSNLSAGGSVVKHVLTREEKRLCKVIGNKLVKDGLYFVGLDIINNKLIEVNVLSPGGLVSVNKMNKTRVQIPIIDYLEDMVEMRHGTVIRIQEYRNEVKDA